MQRSLLREVKRPSIKLLRHRSSLALQTVIIKIPENSHRHLAFPALPASYVDGELKRKERRDEGDGGGVSMTALATLASI